LSVVKYEHSWPLPTVETAIKSLFQGGYDT